MSNIIRDSLNLTELKHQAEKARQRAKRDRQIRQVTFIAVIFIYISLIFTPIIYESFLLALANRIFISINLLIGIIALAASAIMLFLSYRQYLQFNTRINAYAPAFVPRLNSFRASFQFSHILVFIAIVAIIAFELPIILFVLLALINYAAQHLYVRLLSLIVRGGLSRVTSALRWFPRHVVLLNAKASYLLNAGSIAEAEQIWFGLLKRTDYSARNYTSLWLNDVGMAMILSERFEAALPILEASIRILPGFGSPYDSLASWYLEQQIDPERAVELCEISVGIAQPPDSETAAIEQATYARALALTKRDIRAEAMLQQALNIANREMSPTTKAEIHRQAGYARLAQGNIDAARSYFEQAISIDADGLIGKLANRGLEKLDSTEDETNPA